MAVAIVTGSCGLVGRSLVHMLIDEGLEVVGIDNDMRGRLFGVVASTAAVAEELRQLPMYCHYSEDIRDRDAMLRVFKRYASSIALVVHTAGQPSHDWSGDHPVADFHLNAVATVDLLESCRTYSRHAAFVLLSTNKVYGDSVNGLPLVELDTRWECPDLPVGVNEDLPIDHTMHSPFGVSKAAADLMVQEYGRYYDMDTCCFRCGCLTGAGHRGIELHGFLAYLGKCVREGRKYVVFGYGGKQVRDNLHADDVATAVWEFFCDPSKGAVYNLGGGRPNSCSVLEAIGAMQEISGMTLSYTYMDSNRKGDHKWWITDTSRFSADYPGWMPAWGLEDIYEVLLNGD